MIKLIKFIIFNKIYYSDNSSAYRERITNYRECSFSYRENSSNYRDDSFYYREDSFNYRDCSQYYREKSHSYRECSKPPKKKEMRKHKRTSVHVPSSSIVLDLKPVLKARNIKHPFAYLEQLGMNPNSISKILKGKAVQLNFDQLTKLCVHLNCTPNDLFALRDMTLPEKHQLHALSIYNPQTTEPTIEEWMLGKSVSEIRELMG